MDANVILAFRFNFRARLYSIGLLTCSDICQMPRECLYYLMDFVAL